MSQRLFKGRTNNHLTWVMVDSTDFATPESALSAATKIKIYGKLRGGTGVNFVSSGTGSLTNDIQHVGASVLGIYTIALAKADLSDASAAWYDQYIVSLSATGAAYQMLVAEGVIDESALSVIVSDAHSAAAQANSRVLLVQSRLSDLDSRLVSDLSDLYSQVLLATSAASDAASAAVVGASRILLVQSRLSDFDSRLVSDISDVRSMLSDMMSDFQSRVPKRVATDSQLSDLHSDLRSYLVVMSGVQSDLYSAVSDLQSDFQSRVPKRVATDSQLSDAHSDLKSAIAAITASVSASDISDIASAVWANTIGARVDSRILVAQSYLSDIRSHVSDLQSDFQSRVPKRVATDSQLSDVHSDLKSAIGAITVTISASDVSDIASAVVAGLPIASTVSDIYSMLSDLYSDFQSRVPKRVATDSQLSDLVSDVKSAVTVVQSMASDAASAAQQANSRVLLVQSQASDVYSLLSDFQSDFGSRVPKRVATDSQLSDVLSDLRSLIGAGVEIGASSMSDIRSTVLSLSGAISDAHSAATQANSRVLVAQSHVSDIYSLLSDLHSDVAVLSGVVSDAYSGVAAVKTQTDKLTFDANNYVAANVRQDYTGAVVDDAGNSASTFKTNRTEATDDYWKDAYLRITSGAMVGQVKKISAYNGTTKFVTVTGGFTAEPADAVTFDLITE